MSYEQVPVLDVATILPNYVKKLPFNLKYGWMSAFNLAADLYGIDRAVTIANSWVLNKIEELKAEPVKEDDRSDEVKEQVMEMNKDELVTNSESALISINLQPINKELISLSEDGDIVLEAVLADTQFNTLGKRFSEGALISMAKTINDEGMYLPDIDHEIYNSLVLNSKSTEEVVTKLKSEKGLLKKINAVYKNGKLFIKALLDKRYKNHVDKYKFLSIEADGMYRSDDPDLYFDAKPYSFTFTNKPKLRGAEIINVRS